MYFVILTAALTLQAHGKTDIQTSRDAAEAVLACADPDAVAALLEDGR